MNVLSLFDGISCGRMALEKVGILPNMYIASEIDTAAICGANAIYPDTIQIGDVMSVNVDELPNIDLLIGGSPCQSFSRSGDGSGFDGSSKLFFEYVRVLNDIRKINPNVKFLLENVVMKKEWEDVITHCLGVDPVMIDSKLVSAQKRQRLYWTNIDDVTQPKDLNITTKDIIDDDYIFVDVGDLMWYDEGEFRVRNATKLGYLVVNNYDSINLDFPTSKTRRGRVGRQKTNTLNTSCNQGIFINGQIKKLTAVECGRLQTIDDDKIDKFLYVMTENQFKHACGNGWTVDVIAHIFKGLKK